MQDGSGGFSQDAVYDSARQGPVAPARLREAVQYVQNGDIAAAKAAAGMASGREARRPRRIADIVHRRRGVSADTASRLARYFGTTAEFWCNLQSAHELSVVAATKRQELARIIPHGQKAAAATAVS